MLSSHTRAVKSTSDIKPASHQTLFVLLPGSCVITSYSIHYTKLYETPGANPLEVAARVHVAMDEIRAGLPPGLNAHIPYDASVYINDSIDEVFKTLAEGEFP